MPKNKKHKKKKGNGSAVDKAAGQVPESREEGRNILMPEAELFAKRYTNEHIRKQISDDSCLFFAIVGMFLFAFFLILLSFVRSYLAVRSDPSFFRWVNEVRENHPLGLVFGLTIIIFAGVGAHECNSKNMFKHIRPACSGRRLSAKEIDDMANDPATVRDRETGVFETPQALIGINKGLTVICYDDIAGISLRSKHHSENTSHSPGRGRMGISRAAYYVLTDHYREWDTYYIVIRTKKHRKMVLTETAYRRSYESLLPVLKEKCGDIDYDVPERQASA